MPQEWETEWRILYPLNPNKAVIRNKSGDRTLVTRLHNSLYTTLGYDANENLREVILAFDKQTGCPHTNADELARQIADDIQKRGKHITKALEHAETFHCCDPIWNNGKPYHPISIARTLGDIKKINDMLQPPSFQHGDMLTAVCNMDPPTQTPIRTKKIDYTETTTLNIPTAWL